MSQRAIFVAAVLAASIVGATSAAACMLNDAQAQSDPVVVASSDAPASTDAPAPAVQPNSN